MAEQRRRSKLIRYAITPRSKCMLISLQRDRGDRGGAAVIVREARTAATRRPFPRRRRGLQAPRKPERGYRQLQGSFSITKPFSTLIGVQLVHQMAVYDQACRLIVSVHLVHLSYPTNEVTSFGRTQVRKFSSSSNGLPNANLQQPK